MQPSSLAFTEQPLLLKATHLYARRRDEKSTMKFCEERKDTKSNN
jgi:hypothetical protein